MIMGMTIDEAIRYGAEFQEMNKFSKDTSPYEFTSTAIDTMYKYQKVQEIFERYDKGELTHNMFELLVGEVLEDGKDD